MIGPCAKRRVMATLVTPSGHSYSGENLCRNAQPVCPRAPGEGYEKCRTVCGQTQHAEIAALNTAMAYHDGDLSGSAIYVHHHYACGKCTAALDAAGVHIVCTAPVDSERTPDQ